MDKLVGIITDWLRGTCLIVVIVASLVSLAEAQSGGRAAAECTRAELRAYRTGTFNSLMSKQRYKEAVSGLSQFIQDGGCDERLNSGLREATHTGKAASNEASLDAAELLWARSDLALAYLKDGQPGKCLQIIDSARGEEPSNSLDQVAIPALKRAFEVNRGLCEKRRLELFPGVEAKGCPAGALPREVSLALSEESEPQNYKVKATPKSIQIPTETGFECVAVFKIPVMRGILDDLCSSQEECRSSGNPDDSSELEIAELFGLQSAGSKSWVRLNYKGEVNWCGDPKLSLHNDASLGGKEVVLRVQSELSPCVTGTGRAAVDSFFALKGAELVERDVSAAVYH